jgi:hypothetical protein
MNPKISLKAFNRWRLMAIAQYSVYGDPGCGMEKEPVMFSSVGSPVCPFKMISKSFREVDISAIDAPRAKPKIKAQIGIMFCVHSDSYPRPIGQMKSIQGQS